ncbi:MAG: HAMP domain-containing protein, partial [Anaerolineae bacterium]
MMSTRPSTPKKKRQTNRSLAIGSIRGRLLLASVVTIFLTAMVISVASVAISLRNGRREAVERLELVAELKGVEIDEWVRQVSSTLARPLQQAPESSIVDTELSDVVTTFLDNPAGSEARTNAYESLAYNLGLWLQQVDQYEVILVMDRDGQVLASTDPLMEGQFLADDPLFQEGTLGSYLAPLSYSQPQGRATTFTSRPIYGEFGRLLGVVAATVDASTLDRVMRLRERASLGESGESYLVGADRSMVTNSRFAEAGTTVDTRGVAAAIEAGQPEEGAGRYDVAATEMVGSGSYRNYGNTRVIGVYRWIPDMQSALMVEQSRAEVFRAIYGAVLLNGIVALISALLAGAISLSMARGISDRLAGLVEAASEIAAGNLERTAQVGRRDEIGTLAEAFNTMTARLRGLIGSLEQRVEERTRDLQRRARQIEAAAEVARDATAIRDVDTLLNETVDLVSERFGFYHAGIFLVDDPGEFAVLRAASSEGGQGMLERGHRLRVGQVGIVGY